MMTKPLVVFGMLSTLPLFAAAALPQGAPARPAARQCLHGTGEAAAQSTRRMEGLTATRTINNIQANRPEAKDGSYLRQDQLAAAPYALGMKDSKSEVVRRMSL